VVHDAVAKRRGRNGACFRIEDFDRLAATRPPCCAEQLAFEAQDLALSQPVGRLIWYD